MKNKYLVGQHLCFGGLMFLLIIFIVNQQKSSRYQQMIIAYLTPQMEQTIPVLQADINDLLKKIIQEARDYQSDQSKDYANRAVQIVSITDSLINCLSGNCTKHLENWSAIKTFQQQLLNLCDLDPAYQKYLMEKSVFTKDSIKYNRLVSNSQLYADLKQYLIHAEVKQACLVSLNYCFTKVSGSKCGTFEYKIEMTNNPLNPSLQDTVTIETFLSNWSRIDEHTLFLNNDTLIIKDGIAKFRLKYGEQGCYPLHVKAIVQPFNAMDTVRTVEKTYWLNIR